MRQAEVRERAFAMPLTNPAYPPGPYRFIDREYLTITYRTDPAKLRAVCRSRWSSTSARRWSATSCYKHRQADLNAVKASLAVPNFLLKIIPHVDGSPRVCELVEYHLEDVALKGAWTGPAALALTPHALAPVAELPVVEVVSAVHILADLTLGLGKVVHDYMP